jgi:SAM-dependent methyltransferase
MYDYHDNRRRYFEHQKRVTADYVIPFVEGFGSIPRPARILEIGCAEAGVLSAFLDRGDVCVGVDLSRRRLSLGREFQADAINGGRLELLEQDAHVMARDPRFAGQFDLIVLKDVIEHVDDRPALLSSMSSLLADGGRVFLSFPPWRMPFGGHQQICRSRVLSRVPYLHLLPTRAYERVLRRFGETESRVKSLMATRRTGIGISEFEQLCGSASYRVVGSRHYLFNPMYTYRFGLTPKEQARWLSELAPVRDFVTTCAYFLVAPSHAH